MKVRRQRLNRPLPRQVIYKKASIITSFLPSPPSLSPPLSLPSSPLPASYPTIFMEFMHPSVNFSRASFVVLFLVQFLPWMPFNTFKIKVLNYLFVVNLSGELQTFWTNVTPPSTVHQYGVNYGKGHTIQKRYRGPPEVSGTDSNQSTPRLKPRKKPLKTGARSVDELSVSGVAVRPTKQAAGVRRS